MSLVEGRGLLRDPLSSFFPAGVDRRIASAISGGLAASVQQSS